MTQFFFQVPIYLTIEAPDEPTAKRYATDICAAALLADRGHSIANIAAQSTFAEQHRGARCVDVKVSGPALITDAD